MKLFMNHPLLVAAFFLSMIAAGVSASAQSISSLHTRNASLRFENTSTGPHLIDLRTKDHQLWSNRATEVSLDSVEVDGQRLSVDWKFKPEASIGDAHRVAYVYESLPRSGLRCRIGGLCRFRVNLISGTEAHLSRLDPALVGC